ncbi:MAG: hypothetical protein QMD13_07990 [Candidatus Bathyarchaeia archaeon]|nr:hypothetical protein [Candidatus Bathyarchaeia archaeon]
MSIERRLFKAKDLVLDRATDTLTIPIGGGFASKTLTFTKITDIAYIIAINVLGSSPKIGNINVPQINIEDNTIGLTIYAGTGTTLTVEALALG